jgi:hypothetical protein
VLACAGWWWTCFTVAVVAALNGSVTSPEMNAIRAKDVEENVIIFRYPKSEDESIPVTSRRSNRRAIASSLKIVVSSAKTFQKPIADLGNFSESSLKRSL